MLVSIVLDYMALHSISTLLWNTGIVCFQRLIYSQAWVTINKLTKKGQNPTSDVCAVQLPVGSGINVPFEVGIQAQSLQVNIKYSKLKKKKKNCRILIFHPDHFEHLPDPDTWSNCTEFCVSYLQKDGLWIVMANNIVKNTTIYSAAINSQLCWWNWGSVSPVCLCTVKSQQCCSLD